ncbi:MAG: hypothetical protein LBV23_09755 [Deltaproteobacteria bacterium]|jgi:PfaB family protein|nr:hypothetical protein [Deltaproteobacteria bacterium]
MIAAREPFRAAALVAVGLIVPGADDPLCFWNNIVENRVFFRQAQKEDFGVDPALFYQEGEPAHDKAYNLTGAWISKPSFKAQEHLKDLKLPSYFDPFEADDSLLYWLAAAKKALGSVNLSAHAPEKLGVILGHVILPTRTMAEATLALYGRQATRSWPFNPFHEPPRTNPFRCVGYSAKLSADTFGFGGQSFTVDAACASSLYALKLALDRLRDGSLSCVLTGGLAKADPLFTQLGFSQLRALSKSGLSRPFTQQSDGLIVGSGAVALVLKRLETALADGDEIIALITGVGLSNDRQGNILAPDSEGQIRAMVNAFNDSSLPPLVAPELIEAHGTSTLLGDAVEIKAIKGFLSTRHSRLTPVIGSVKGNLGHLLSAAGAASIVKAALAVNKGILPPTVGALEPNKDLDLQRAPEARLLNEAEKWSALSTSLGRIAAVNAFGFGGVNAQAVVEEFIPKAWCLGASVLKPKRKSLIKKNKLKGEPSLNIVELESTSPSTPPSASVEELNPNKDSGQSQNQNQINNPEQGQGQDFSAFLIAARTCLAPWPNYQALARYWLTPEEPPVASTRRMGGLKASGFFFDKLSFDAQKFRLPPKELAEALPQQTLAFKAALAALDAAGLDPERLPPSLDLNRVGIFMGVNIDPRASDYALRWLAQERVIESIKNREGDNSFLSSFDVEKFAENLALTSSPPLTHSRVLGALGSLVSSRLARYLGAGGPAFTMAEEKDCGLRALREAMRFIAIGEVDVALVGVVDSFGDPKTAALAPKTVWVEGAAAMLLASPKGAEILQPLAELTLTEADYKLGPLSAVFALNRSGYYLRHHLKPLGLGHGFAYWLQNPDDPPRSLSGPGYVLSETPGASPFPLSVPSDPVRLDVCFFIKGNDRADLNRALSELESLIEIHPQKDLTLLSRQWLRANKENPLRASAVIFARDQRELLSLIKRTRAGEVDRDFKPKVLLAPAEEVKGQLAFVYPGSGNLYKGLGRGLALCYPQVMSKLEGESKDPLGLFQSQLLWTPNYKRLSCREHLLAHVSFALIATRVLEHIGLSPQASLGYSLGETGALVALGLWPDRDELLNDLINDPLFNSDLCGECNAARNYWGWKSNKPLKWLSAMIPRPESEIKAALEALSPPYRHRVFLALVNTREEATVVGEEAAVQMLAQALEAPIFPSEDVPTVHAPVVTQVADRYIKFHTRRVVLRPEVTIYSSFEAAPLKQESEAIALSLYSQALSGHNFPSLVERAYADGVRYFVEVGPGNSATRMIKSILGRRPHAAQSLATTAIDEGASGLNRVLAELWLCGYPINSEQCLLSEDPPTDSRFEVPINLNPPELNWPAPFVESPSPQVAPAPTDEEDYLSWLERQAGAKAGGNKAEGAPYRAETKIKGLESNKLSTPEVSSEASSASSPAAPSEAPIGRVPSDIGPGAIRVKASQEKQEEFEKPRFKREQCLEFAIGSAAKSLGPKFAAADDFPSRVRLPDEPLMFVDRVLTIEGDELSMGPGRIVTEHDVGRYDWCIENGRISCGMAVESGQADLMLSGYLGADMVTKGLARYRLLDAEVVFFGDPPFKGEVARYDIRILNFFSHGQTEMFRFEFDGAIKGGDKFLSMRRGCAGFFTQEALDSGKGLTLAFDTPAEGEVDPGAAIFSEALEVKSLSSLAVKALRKGDPSPLGPSFSAKAVIGAQLLPSGNLALIDKVTKIDPTGGAYGHGFIRAEFAIKPNSWFLISHFKDDEVMPGTLMYDASLQTLRIYLLLMGWLAPAELGGFAPVIGLGQSLKCRGQVTPKTKRAAYEVHLKKIGFVTNESGKETEPMAVADAVMWADGRPIALASDIGLRLKGASRDYLQNLWQKKSSFHSPTLESQKAPNLVGQSEEPKKAQAVRRKIVDPAAESGSAIDEPVSERVSEKQGLTKKQPKGPQDETSHPNEPLAEEAVPKIAPAAVVTRRVKPPTASTAPTAAPLAVRRKLKGNDLYDKAALTQMSTGLLSKALGPLYQRFDDLSFVARLPRAPYDFIDQAEIKKGRLGQIITGTQVEAIYDLDLDPQRRPFLLDNIGGKSPAFPYAALNEIALQPCGFLSAYMGSALAFEGPMHFRNLGGEASVKKPLTEISGRIITKAVLLKSSVLGAMVIQRYYFSSYMNEELIYEGKASFGFHAPESFTRQGGVKAPPSLLKALSIFPEPGSFSPYPQGPAWPKGPWLMLDNYSFLSASKYDHRLWAKSKVEAKAWFFTAHFPYDPVWPGSLGLEGFIEAAKVLAALILGERDLSSFNAVWSSPAPGRDHRWVYRGQITPMNREAIWGIRATEIDRALKQISFSGLLWVDSKIVYQIDDFTVRIL